MGPVTHEVFRTFQNRHPKLKTIITKVVDYDSERKHQLTNRKNQQDSASGFLISLVFCSFRFFSKVVFLKKKETPCLVSSYEGLQRLCHWANLEMDALGCPAPRSMMATLVGWMLCCLVMFRPLLCRSKVYVFLTFSLRCGWKQLMKGASRCGFLLGCMIH